jgi:acyl-CoA reductase-like NAD-dependent aldehyde dehydrogenase
VSLVRNVDVVAALVRAFRTAPSVAVRQRILEACVTLLTINRDNYAVLERHRTLSPLVEALPSLPLALKVGHRP